MSAAGGADVLSFEASLLSAGRQAALAAAAASLPQLLRPAADGREPDIRIVDGTAPSWPRALAAALDARARGVLLTAPALAPAAEAEALAAEAESARCPVVVAMPLPYDATIRAGIARLRKDRETLSLIDATAMVGDDGGLPPRARLGAAFLAQLAAIRTIIGPVPALTVNLRTDRAYSAAGTGDGVTVMLAGLISSLPAPVLRVDLVGPRRRHTICLAEPAPATFLSYDASGMRRPSPGYESGLRGAWRDLHAAVTCAEPVRHGLRDLAATLACAAPWSRWPG